MLSPLAATRFAQTKRWSFHYLISMALAFSSMALFIIIFRLRSGDGLSIAPYSGMPVNRHHSKNAWRILDRERRRNMLAKKAVWSKSCGYNLCIYYRFTFWCMSVWKRQLEVSQKFYPICLSLPDDTVRFTGWIVTYIIREKGGEPSSGYISSGYFGGEYRITCSNSENWAVPRNNDWACRLTKNQREGAHKC